MSSEQEGHGAPLPDDACPTCGTMMFEARASMPLPINGEEVSVPGVEHLECPKCGEVVLRREQARSLRQAALARYRAAHSLLSSDEIRAIRDRHRLTQAEMAELLRLGGNTLSRWESGRNVQSAAMDVLLRLLRDGPGTLDYLRRPAA